MNTTLVEELSEDTQKLPGAQLAALRIEHGYSTDYVAGKLHLRVRIIELLENDDYQNLPEPVFIKGYLRAYAILVGVKPNPIVDQFNSIYTHEKTTDKTLWQSRRETNRAEHAIRWLTSSFAIIVIIAVATWWYNNKDNEQLFPESVQHAQASPAKDKAETEIRLTDLSKMRSLLSAQPQADTQPKTDIQPQADTTEQESE